jgi:uncharacterized protein involved in exopolysaccharide biosynthesis
MTIQQIFCQLYVQRRLLLITVFSVALVGFLASYLVAPRYRAMTKMMVIQNQGSSALGNLGNMAGALGLDLSQGASSLDLYAEYVMSRDLLAEMVSEPWRPEGGDETSLLSHWGEDGSDHERLIVAIEKFERSLQVRTIPMAGVLEVTVETFDPHLSAYLAKKFVTRLNEFNAELKQWTGTNRAATLEGRLEEVMSDLKVSEDSLMAFRVMNLDISHPKLRLEESRLIRDVTIQTEILQTIQVQKEMARLEAKSGEPVLRVLQTAHPPLGKSWPRRGRIVLILALAAFVLSAYCIVALAVFRQPDEN